MGSFSKDDKEEVFRRGIRMAVMKIRDSLITEIQRNLCPSKNLMLWALSWRLDADSYETDSELKKIREARGYSYMHFCEVCPEKLPNYEKKIKNFYEHLHTDEEIRCCIAGNGCFDIRDRDESWICIWVKKGAMIVLPAGIYHRFTLDSGNYIEVRTGRACTIIVRKILS